MKLLIKISDTQTLFYIYMYIFIIFIETLYYLHLLNTLLSLSKFKTYYVTFHLTYSYIWDKNTYCTLMYHFPIVFLSIRIYVSNDENWENIRVCFQHACCYFCARKWYMIPQHQKVTFFFYKPSLGLTYKNTVSIQI